MVWGKYVNGGNLIWLGAGMILGSAISCVVTSVILKKAFIKENQKQIDEVVKYYESQQPKPEPEKVTPVEAQEEKVIFKNIEEPVVQEEVPEEPEDFEVDLQIISMGDLPDLEEGYSTETFTFYADGILTDDCDIPLSETKIDGLFGPDIYDEICRSIESVLFIKNPMERVIYEIVMCPTEFNG